MRLNPICTLPLILALPACSVGGGKGSESAWIPPPPKREHVSFTVTAPPDLYFNQHGQITVLVVNDGDVSVYAPLTLTMDGAVVDSYLVPTLAPGEQHLATFPIWAAQDLTVLHAFTVTAPTGWSQAFSVQYHGLTGG